MDRSLIAPWKAEEKELCEKLFKKLQGLVMLYAPSEELRSCLSVDMFLKPNQMALLHVMQFLFRILDPTEFKKRFFWPITDKRSEANFRASTIEYLKHLNEKHNLRWNNITSYLVVKPGGMKFINFLLEFVSFVIQEITKQREKHLGLELNATCDLNMKRMRAQNKFFKQYASQYISAVDKEIEKWQDKRALIKNQLNILSRKTGLSVDQLTQKAFITDFESSNRTVFRERFGDWKTVATTSEETIAEFKNAIEKQQLKEREFKYDKIEVHKALQKIGEVYAPQNSRTIATQGSTEIQLKDMLSAFERIYDTISAQFQRAEVTPIVSSVFVKPQIESISKELDELQFKMDGFQKLLYTSGMNVTECQGQLQPQTPVRDAHDHLFEHAPLMKLIYTPPFKPEMLEAHQNAKMRLALADDLPGKTYEHFNSYSVVRSTRKFRQAEYSVDRANSSSIKDPIQILRTIKRERTRRQNLSELGLNVKPRQCLYTDESSGEECGEQAQNTLVQSPMTPFNTKERTRIACAEIQGPTSSSSFYKSLIAVKKVQDASVNLQNMSISPSCRLEPLVSVEDNFQLLDNNADVLKHTEAHTEFGKELYSCENDMNIANVTPINLFTAKSMDEELISKMSDSVLEDLPF